MVHATRHILSAVGCVTFGAQRADGGVCYLWSPASRRVCVCGEVCYLWSPVYRRCGVLPLVPNVQTCVCVCVSAVGCVTFGAQHADDGVCYLWSPVWWGVLPLEPSVVGCVTFGAQRADVCVSAEGCVTFGAQRADVCVSAEGCVTFGAQCADVEHLTSRLEVGVVATDHLALT